MNRPAAVLFLALMTIMISCIPGKRRSDTISISGAWALYPLAVRWAEEFRKENPGIRIDISAGGAGKGIADLLGGLVEIGMVSRDINRVEFEKGALPIAVAKDAVVAVISERNPALNDILRNGITSGIARRIWMAGTITGWGEIQNISSGERINVYTRSDACGAAETWAAFLGGSQEDLLGSGVYGDPGLALAVSNDPLGIGYNNIAYVYDIRTGLPVKGLKIIPVDLNNNGKIDDDEDFYGSLHELTEAIASGKFPSPPARDLYFVLRGPPDDNSVLEKFMKWVLKEGQKYVNESGYVALPEETVTEGLNRL